MLQRQIEIKNSLNYPVIGVTSDDPSDDAIEAL